MTWFNKIEFPGLVTHDNSGKGDHANMVRSEEAVAQIFPVPHVIFVLSVDDLRIVQLEIFCCEFLLCLPTLFVAKLI